MDRTDGNLGIISARRRLLRGTFAVPAVAALHSGSALAASSSLQCVQNQAASPIFPVAVGAPDMYLRVQLYQLLSAPGSSTVLGWYLSGSTVEAARFGERRITNALLSAGRWKKVNLENGLAKLAPETLYAPPPGHCVLGPRWVALRVLPVRDRGWRIEIVGVVDGTTMGTAVTGSCWTSFSV
jgi:hypothetical protein